MTGAEAVDLSAYREPLEIARGLVRLGVPLFTAADRGGGRFWLPSEWQRTPVDETVVDRWRPGMALCAVTGVVFDVIDVDPRNDGFRSFQELVSVLPERRFGMTLTVSGGWHVWIMALGLHKKTNLRPGIDYQGGAPDGEGRGFVYLPPTVRPSRADGQLYSYTWQDPTPSTWSDAMRVDQGNLALREMITMSSGTSGGLGGSTDYSDPDLDPLLRGGIPVGEAQDRILRDVVWKLILAGQSDEVIYTLWKTIVSRSPETKPGEPWTDGDFHRHLDRAREQLGKPMTSAERLALLPSTDDVVDGVEEPSSESLPPEMEERIAREQLRLRVLREAQEREDAYLVQRARAGDVTHEVLDGETFIFKEILEIESFWGRGTEVLWPRDEGLMIAGPQGIGKTTIIQNLLLRRVGIGDGPLYGYEIDTDDDEDGLYLYLAMDRPAQARRSIRRMVADNPVDRGIVQKRLRFWAGPLPLNPAKGTDPDALLRWATAYCGGRVPAAIFCDSYKDLAVGLSKDDVGASLNLMVQAVIAGGAQWVGAHHHRKGDGQRAPKLLDDVYGSTWLTSGLGSVLLAWGEPGDAAIEVTQLKEPSDKINPLRLVHDPVSGWLTIDGEENVDPVDVIRRHGAAGISASDLALELYGRRNPADRHRAKRVLDRMVEGRVVSEVPGGPRSSGSGRPALWYRLTEFDLPGERPSAEGLRRVFNEDGEMA